MDVLNVKPLVCHVLGQSKESEALRKAISKVSSIGSTKLSLYCFRSCLTCLPNNYRLPPQHLPATTKTAIDIHLIEGVALLS